MDGCNYLTRLNQVGLVLIAYRVIEPIFYAMKRCRVFAWMEKVAGDDFKNRRPAAEQNQKQGVVTGGAIVGYCRITRQGKNHREVFGEKLCHQSVNGACDGPAPQPVWC